MEFMILFLEAKGQPDGGLQGFAAMHDLAGELASAKKLRRGAPLAGAELAARVRVREGKALVTDGPFAETKEILGGFWVVDVADRDAAIEIARRCPHVEHGIVEVHPVLWRDAVADSGEATPFLLAFHREPGLTDADGAKMREMLAFTETLKQQGKFLETAPLAREPVASRLEKRGGRIVATDGPFAETKEGVGGYALVRVADRDAAIDLAKRYPHAKWGPVEVRQILFFDRT
jgi:hypothetical protein